MPSLCYGEIGVDSKVGASSDIYIMKWKMPPIS